jgi:hypothetical protein
MRRNFAAMGVDNPRAFCYNYHRGFIWGEMAERFKALVLKTSDVERHRGFESLSLRHCDNSIVEKYPRGRRGSPAKGVGCDKCREGSNPSFSAKSPKTQCFQGFSDFYFFLSFPAMRLSIAAARPISIHPIVVGGSHRLKIYRYDLRDSDQAIRICRIHRAQQFADFL